MKLQFNKQGYWIIKIPLVKYFLGEAYKLRGFLTQIKIKITNKGLELLMAIEQVAYTGLFFLGRVLK